MEEKQILRVSVRNLVEFILRQGDIERTSGGFYDREAMQEGSRMHRKIQRRMGASYQAEYFLRELVDCGKCTLAVEGRADGVWTHEGAVAVDEIKGVYADLQYLAKPRPLHLAQAKCYAWMYAKQHALEEISVRMTYVNLDTEEIKYFYEDCAFSDLTAWMDSILTEYCKWSDFEYEWGKARQESIPNVRFPYAYREGQKELAEAVYRTIYHKRRLFVQASTGIGKTLSVIFPAVKAVGQNKADKLFYLTAKTVTREAAMSAFSLLLQQGLCYKVLALTAKEKMCVCEEVNCDPGYCPRAKGHFDRVNQALYELLTTQQMFSREMIAEHAARHQVCPFEFSLDLAVWCDAIVCDYNYVFDPQVSLKRFFSEGGGKHLFLVDEAHNLVERGREMFSASLCKEELMSFQKCIAPHNRKAAGILKRCNQQMLEFKRECDEGCRVLPGIGTLSILLSNLAMELETMLLSVPGGELREQILSFYFQVRSFLGVYEMLDENYLIYSEMMPDQTFVLHLFCVNPARNIGRVLAKGISSIFFSATMLPVSYYSSLLSDRDDDYAICARSPCLRENRRIFVASDVSSRYLRRTRSEYEKIAAYILTTARAKTGNYLVFFPSYHFMKEVSDCLPESEDVIVQEQSAQMTEQEREVFLQQFLERPLVSRVGFCVLGGVFSEGIDLPGDRLIGVIVVGTGLAQPDHRGELLKEYYAKHGRDGFAYAYRIPGMNRVMQAAGRVIRTALDRGVILLLDDRFLQRDYLELFPEEWADYRVCRLQSIDAQLRQFWEKGCGSDEKTLQ